MPLAHALARVAQRRRRSERESRGRVVAVEAGRPADTADLRGPKFEILEFRIEILVEFRIIFEITCIPRAGIWTWN